MKRLYMTLESVLSLGPCWCAQDVIDLARSAGWDVMSPVLFEDILANPDVDHEWLLHAVDGDHEFLSQLEWLWGCELLAVREIEALGLGPYDLETALWSEALEDDPDVTEEQLATVRERTQRSAVRLIEKRWNAAGCPEIKGFIAA